ncbi:GntR family transcriptional regulator [Streptomyces sp. NPDC090442]|uniref:GntR family transcriptional regulator n=1 Tax=Streptomyces sp. NPDC090442 TaxID=3365962 RepID=UPI0038156C4D
MGAKYRKIAHDLRERITRGTLAPGAALPYMKDIAAGEGVSDITVRKALAELSREGLIESRGRAGWYVRLHPSRTRLTVRHRSVERDDLGYYSGPESQGWRPLPWEGSSPQVDTAPVPVDVAEILGVAPESPQTIRRRIVGDPDRAEHRQLADSWLAPWIVDEVPQTASNDTGPGGLVDRVEQWAGRPLTWREVASARMPTPEEATLLGMPRTGAALLRVLRIAYLSGRGRGAPRTVEVQDVRMSGDLFALGYPVPRGPSARWPVPAATGAPAGE